MACYIQGVTPSSGNEKTATANQKINLQQIKENIKKHQLEMEAMKQRERFQKMMQEAKTEAEKQIMQKLEQREQELQAKKEALELAIKKQDYSSMSNIELQILYHNAIKHNLPNKDYIRQEIVKRIGEFYTK